MPELLTILSGLALPSAGVARVAGRDLLAMSTADRLHYRRHTVGFLFQQASDRLAVGGGPAPEDVTELPRAAAARRIERVLWNDPATGVMPHAAAGNETAIDCARQNGLDLPFLE